MHLLRIICEMFWKQQFFTKHAVYVVLCSAGATCAYMDYISLLSDADDSDADVELQEALHASLRSKFIARLLSL